MAIALTICLGACGKPAGTAAQSSTAEPSAAPAPETAASGDLAFQKFAEPVDVHIAMGVNPLDTTLPEGDSVDNNQYTRYLLENYNINIICDWTAANGPDFDQKVALSIASNSLPDGLSTSRMYMLKAAKSDLLYDITDLFSQYASEQVRGVMASTDGRAMENASYNGRMVSLVGVDVKATGPSNLNIRKDWLEECGLEVPRTLDDIEQVALAFMEKKPGGRDDLIAMMGPDKNSRVYGHFLDSSGAAYGFDPVFAAYDAYPGYWLDNADGSVTYGSAEAEKMKKALGRLADWYAKGIIDPEMGTRERSAEVANNGQAAMYFGPWWVNGYGGSDVFRNNPDANWQTYPVYDDEGKWNTHLNSVTSTHTIMSKNAPEDAVKAMIIMSNALLRDESTFYVSVELGWYPIRNLMAPYDECEFTYGELYKVLEGEVDPAGYQVPDSSYKLLGADVVKVAEVVENYEKGQELASTQFRKDDMGKFMRMHSLLIGNRPLATQTPDKEVYSITYTMTETMEKKWSNLKKMEDEIILKIITGQTPVEEYDAFVANWHAQGGDEILAEVAELR